MIYCTVYFKSKKLNKALGLQFIKRPWNVLDISTVFQVRAMFLKDTDGKIATARCQNPNWKYPCCHVYTGIRFGETEFGQEMAQWSIVKLMQTCHRLNFPVFLLNSITSITNRCKAMSDLGLMVQGGQSWSFISKGHSPSSGNKDTLLYF